MIFKTVVPILYSRDIPASLAYYTDILGFTDKWSVGDPPNFGGIIKDSVEVFFCREGQGSPGTWLAIMVGNVDEYYEKVKDKGAKIPWGGPQDMEHGIREFFVEDPDGHILRFGQTIPAANHHGSGRKPAGTASQSLPTTVRITEKQPTNPAIVYSVIAEDAGTGQTVGAAQLLGDNNGFFYVKDVYVNPEWQGRGIGTALMQAVTDWLGNNAPGKASVWLHTAEHLQPFYKQFGFITVPGMARFLPSRES